MQEILMGNEAVALGLLEKGCNVISAYPGTPSSEVLPFAAKLKNTFDLPCFVEWSINEKSAFELVYANAIIGGNSAVIMKQVGLNVAMDSLMSAAYIGLKGAMVVVVADDPGPISSQTEQDTRFASMFAKLPVLDPSSPEEARFFAKNAIELSHKYEIPVILRLTSRISHWKMNIDYEKIKKDIFPTSLKFEKDPFRWAAIPKFRYLQHVELNKKITDISKQDNFHLQNFNNNNNFLIITSGVCYSHILDAINYMKKDNIDILKLDIPYPISENIEKIINNYSKVLIIEETYPVIEYQIRNKKVFGRLTSDIPLEGELTIEKVINIINNFFDLKERGLAPVTQTGKKPELCAGCPHRNSFFLIKKAFPKGIFPSDIGCYTLGLNMDAVDTCLCMGATINQAAGFYQGFKITNSEIPPIIATIGDSTFYHSGVPGLINSLYNKSAFVLVILDNSTTAMTGFQPTPATGQLNSGQGTIVSIENILKGLGIKFLKIINPSEIENSVKTIKNAWQFAIENETVSVIIAKAPCAILYRKKGNYKYQKVIIKNNCTGCKICINKFQCPAIFYDESAKKAGIDYSICIGCGVCVQICPEKAILLNK